MGWTRIFRRKQWDDERARELDAYLEAETADNIARGMTSTEARQAACRKLGNPTHIREEIYRMNSLGFLEVLWQDVRYAARVLRKSPGFAAVAVLSLALGAGANTAVFSLVHGVLLRDLPYPQSDRIVRVGRAGTRGDDVSNAELEFCRTHTASFATVAGHQGCKDRPLVTAGGSEWVRILAVSQDFFRTLGVAPSPGREFDAHETQPNGPRSVILSYDLRHRAFAADVDVIGRTVRIAAESFTVVGVAPRGFWFPEAADVFVPLINYGAASDLGTNTGMIARVKPGVRTNQADAELASQAAAIKSENPDLAEKYSGLSVIPYHEWMVGDVRLKLLLLFGAVVLLLLIACTNLASLLLARLSTLR